MKATVKQYGILAADGDTVACVWATRVEKGSEPSSPKLVRLYWYSTWIASAYEGVKLLDGD